LLLFSAADIFRLMKITTVRSLRIFLLCTATAAFPIRAFSQVVPDSGWPTYGHDPGGMRYSPLAGINRNNVSKLKVAWIFHTGDVQNSPDASKRSGFETTPILVDGMLYITTAFNRVIALDPATGRQKWSYDPKIDRTLNYGDGFVNRGATTWVDTSRSVGQACRTRIFKRKAVRRFR
jgi:quinoprotein glucose dehydrogenase